MKKRLEKILYVLTCFVSILIRNIFLPNPFDSLGDSFMVSTNWIEISLTPDLANYIIEPFLHLLGIVITALYYKRDSQPSWIGSLMYLLFYVMHVIILMLIASWGFSVWCAIPVLVLYLTTHILVKLYIYFNRTF